MAYFIILRLRAQLLSGKNSQSGICYVEMLFLYQIAPSTIPKKHGTVLPSLVLYTVLGCRTQSAEAVEKKFLKKDAKDEKVDFVPSHFFRILQCCISSELFSIAYSVALC